MVLKPHLRKIPSPVHTLVDVGKPYIWNRSPWCCNHILQGDPGGWDELHHIFTTGLGPPSGPTTCHVRRKVLVGVGALSISNHEAALLSSANDLPATSAERFWKTKEAMGQRMTLTSFFMKGTFMKIVEIMMMGFGLINHKCITIIAYIILKLSFLGSLSIMTIYHNIQHCPKCWIQKKTEAIGSMNKIVPHTLEFLS